MASVIIACVFSGITDSAPISGHSPAAVGVKVASGTALALLQGCLQILQYFASLTFSPIALHCWQVIMILLEKINLQLPLVTGPENAAYWTGFARL